MKIEELNPVHYAGKEFTTSSSVEAHNDQEAKQIFFAARKNLLHVNSWHKLAVTASASFQLVDRTGVEVNREVQAGDYFKINLRGQGHKKDKYGWASVDEMEEQIKHSFHVWIAITIRPALSPLHDEHPTHLARAEVINRFVVERRGRIVKVSVFTKTKKESTEADRLLTAFRNTLLVVTALLGLNTSQWKSLVQGILKKPYLNG